MAGEPTIHQQAIDGFYQDLDRSVLGALAFECSFNESGDNGALVSIVYQDNPECSFKIFYESESKYRLEQTPGLYLSSVERTVVPEFSRCRNVLNSWVQRLAYNDAARRRSSASGQVEKVFRQAVERELDSLPNPDEPLSEKEVDERLQGILDRVEALQADLDIQQGELRRLRNDLDRLRAEGGKMPSRSWLRSAWSKVWPFFRDRAPEAGMKMLGAAGSGAAAEAAKEAVKKIVE